MYREPYKKPPTPTINLQIIQSVQTHIGVRCWGNLMVFLDKFGVSSHHQMRVFEEMSMTKNVLLYHVKPHF